MQEEPTLRPCQTVVKLITGENALNSCRGAYVNGTRLCTLCHTEVETVVHLIVNCEALTQKRISVWNNTASKLPAGMLASLGQMGPNEKTEFLCTAFRSPYIADWQTLYEAVASFIHGLYHERVALQNEYNVNT